MKPETEAVPCLPRAAQLSLAVCTAYGIISMVLALVRGTSVMTTALLGAAESGTLRWSFFFNSSQYRADRVSAGQQSSAVILWI